MIFAVLGCYRTERSQAVPNPESFTVVTKIDAGAGTAGGSAIDSLAANPVAEVYPRLLASSGSFAAYADRSSLSGAPSILVRIAGGSGLESLVTIPLAEWEAYPLATWITPTPNAPVQLHLAWEEAGEGTTGSTIYSIEDRVARRVFSNQGSACVPARPVDIDHDGRNELLSYLDSRDGCGLLCKDVLRDFRLGEPSWQEVFEWDGRTWLPMHTRIPAFWDSVAATYSRLADLARESEHPLCRASRARLADRLMGWAARARAVADSGR